MKAEEKNKGKSLKNLNAQKVDADKIKGGQRNNTNPLFDENSLNPNSKFGDKPVDEEKSIRSKINKGSRFSK